MKNFKFGVFNDLVVVNKGKRRGFCSFLTAL